MKNYEKQAKEIIRASQKAKDDERKLESLMEGLKDKKAERASEQKEKTEAMISKAQGIKENYDSNIYTRKEEQAEKTEKFDSLMDSVVENYRQRQYKKAMSKLVLSEEQNSEKLANEMLVTTGKKNDARDKKRFKTQKTKEYEKVNKSRESIWDKYRNATIIGGSIAGAMTAPVGVLTNPEIVDMLPTEAAILGVGVAAAGALVGGVIGNAALSTTLNNRAHRVAQAIAEMKYAKQTAKISAINDFNASDNVDGLAEMYLSSSKLAKYKADKEKDFDPSDKAVDTSFNPSDKAVDEEYLNQREDNPVFTQREDNAVLTDDRTCYIPTPAEDESFVEVEKESELAE